MTMLVYDPASYVPSWGEVEFEMIADDGIEVTFDEDGVTVTTGIAGGVAFTVNNVKTATATVRLMNVSPTNAVLAALASQNRPLGAPLIIKPFQLVDLNGTTFVFGEQTVIQKAAPVVRQKEHGTSEWVFRLAEATVRPGGSLVG